MKSILETREIVQKRLMELALFATTGGDSEEWPEDFREAQLELIRLHTLDARAHDATCVASSIYNRARDAFWL